MKQFSALNLNPKLILKPSPKSPLVNVFMMEQCSLDNLFTKTSTIPFIPDKMIKSISNDKRKVDKANSLFNGRKVQLVDGTFIPLIDKELFKRGIDGRHHNKIVKGRWEKDKVDEFEREEEFEEGNIQFSNKNQKINASIMESQFLAFIYSLLKGQLVDRNFLFSNSFWRLTRTQLGKKGNTLLIRWIIDDPNDLRKYKDSLSSAFLKTIPTIKYHLGKSRDLGRKRRGLERVPELEFEYEIFD